MFFCFRPCAGRVRTRRRRIHPSLVRALIVLGAAALTAGLLFLLPQWLLVALIMLLAAALLLFFH